MDIKIFIAPAACLPRYNYMMKTRGHLAKDYNDLMIKYCLGRCELIESDNENDIRIIFCKSPGSKDHFPDIKSIIPRYSDKIKETCCENYIFVKTDEMVTNKHIIFLKDTSLLPKVFSTNIIVIVKDLKQKKDISSVLKNIKTADICTEEEISETLSIHLERFALEGMREPCENLHSYLFRNPPIDVYDSGDKGEQTIKECEDGTSTKQRPLSEVSNVSSAQMSENYPRARSFNLYSRKEQNRRYKSFIPTDIKESERELIERIHEEFVGVFNRSILPEDEKPRLKDGAYKIDEKLLEDLRVLDSSIESCGYCCSTFQVNVNTKEIPAGLKTKIARIMKSHRIAKHSIVSSIIREFSTCQVGQRVTVKCNHKDISGTLGGIATTSSEESERKWALLSRHVAKFSTDGKLYLANDDSNLESCGEIIKEIRKKETNKPYLDIAAASLDKDIATDSNYVTEKRIPVPGKPCLYAPEKLRGLSVHIQGASTPLGLGIITMPKQVSLKSDNLDENYIIVEDRNKGTPFVKEGDSGAMVVAESEDNYEEEVKLISMVIGERLGKKGSYTTVRLDKGLDQLKSLTDKDFNMC